MSSAPTLFLHLGNKEPLADQILPKFQEQLERDTSIQTYCETMFGGGRLCLAFLATQPKIKKLVLNDRDIGIASLWTSILQYKDKLIERLYDFKPTLEAYDRLSEFLKIRKVSGCHESVLDIGFAELALHRLSHDGRGTIIGSARGGRDQQALKNIDSRWQPHKLSGYIEQIYETLTAYEIEGNGCSSFDFQRVLESSDERMLTFIDPPYWSTGQNLYYINFTEDDHFRLAECLKNSHHAWVASYDDHPAVRSLYSWAKIETITAQYGRWSPKQSPEILIYPKSSTKSYLLPTSTQQSDAVVVFPFSDDTGERKHLQLDQIILDESLWSRADGLRQDVIDEYREALQRGDKFPVLTVFFDGKNHFLVDGWYRYYAYQVEQIQTVKTLIYQGSIREALLFSATINQRHGVRRSQADKRRAVEILLKDEEWSQWSDRTIGRHCGVHHSTVAKYRQQHLISSLANSPVTPERKYRDKHGNETTMDTSNIGGRKRNGNGNEHQSEHTSHQIQLFEHIRHVVESYRVSYPKLTADVTQNCETLTVRASERPGEAAEHPSGEEVRQSLEPFVNQVIQADCLDILPQIPANSVPIVITDVPYSTDIASTDANQEYADYLAWLRECLTELYRVGTPDGRYCFNLRPDVVVNGIIRPFYSHFLTIAESLGFCYRTDVTFSVSTFQSSTALGWGSASNPRLMNPTERVLILYKQQWEKLEKGVSDKLGAEALKLTNGLWVIDPDDRQDVSLHIAKLPLKIPINLLKLLSYKDDCVLDPFAGGGSVGVAAKRLGRQFIMIDQSEQSCEVARERLLRDVHLT
jgi:DNA modification methylase